MKRVIVLTGLLWSLGNQATAAANQFSALNVCLRTLDKNGVYSHGGGTHYVGRAETMIVTDPGDKNVYVFTEDGKFTIKGNTCGVEQKETIYDELAGTLNIHAQESQLFGFASSSLLDSAVRKILEDCGEISDTKVQAALKKIKVLRKLEKVGRRMQPSDTESALGNSEKQKDTHL